MKVGTTILLYNMYNKNNYNLDKLKRYAASTITFYIIMLNGMNVRNFATLLLQHVVVHSPHLSMLSR